MRSGSLFVIRLVSLIIVVGLLGACAQTTPSGIDVGEINVVQGTVPVGEKTNLMISAKGPELQFKWTALRGSLSSSTVPAVEYTAPSEPGSDTVTVEVTGKGSVKVVKNVTLQIVRPTPIPTATFMLPTAPPTFTPVPTSIPTLVPTNTPLPPASTASPTLAPTNPPLPTAAAPAAQCSCTNSGKCNELAWNALNSNNLEQALACAQVAIKSWTSNADAQQAKRVNSSVCRATPDPKNTQAFNSFWADYWAVNDIATAWFIRGEAFYKQSKWTDARDAYRTVIDKYSCGFAWDTQGWFWNVADAAQTKYVEIKSK